MTVHQNGQVEAASPLGLGDGGLTPPPPKTYCVETCNRYYCGKDYTRLFETNIDVGRTQRKYLCPDYRFGSVKK